MIDQRNTNMPQNNTTLKYNDKNNEKESLEATTSILYADDL